MILKNLLRTTCDLTKAHQYLPYNNIKSLRFQFMNELVIMSDRERGTDMKKFIPYIIAGVIIIGGVSVYLLTRKSDTTNTNASETSNNSATVPEPQEQDIIRNFFQLIAEKNVSAAVLSMSSKNTADDSVKQAWGVQFNDWNSVNVTSVETSMPTEWSESRHTYKVTMDVVIDSSAADEAIPYYGYENGQNTRFIPIVKENGLWKVDGIATGP